MLTELFPEVPVQELAGPSGGSFASAAASFLSQPPEIRLLAEVPGSYQDLILRSRGILGTLCDDGYDNDNDGLVDYPADPGCFDYASRSEVTACQDGLDNDGRPGIDFDGGALLDLDENGLIDAQFNPATPAVGTHDPQCTFATVNSEATFSQVSGGGCGIGPELALLLPALLAARHRRRRFRHLRAHLSGR